VETSEPANTKEEEGEVVIEASSILLTSIDIAEFLSEECDSAPTFYARALAKILASACIVVDTKEKAFKFVSGRGCCLLFERTHPPSAGTTKSQRRVGRDP
jgi:hypothetical protein